MTLFELLGGLSCIASALAVSGFGLAIIDRPGRIWRSARKSTQHARVTASSAPAFSPLDLGPVPLKWPSEQVWPPSRLPAMPWPSETWSDDFFRGRAAKPSPAPTATSQTDASTPDDAAGQRAASQKRAEPQKREQPAKSQNRPAKQKTAAPPAPAARPSPDGRVTDKVLLAWADQKGLASAVEMLRDTNGWEFHQSAQHLARVMRARREETG